MPGSLVRSVMAGGDVPEFDVAVLGMPAQQRECLVLVESVGDHQGALGLFDRGPGFGGQLDGHAGSRRARSRCRASVTSMR